MMEITGKTKLFGIIADPVDHVRAPMVFNPAFHDRNIDAVLVPIHILPQHLKETLTAMAQLPNMGGVAVTIPHKMTAAKLCDQLGVAAEVTGAVNAIRFEQGRLIGDNFDGKGFVAGLKGEGHDPREKNAVLIGAGGAARAIAMALAEAGVGRLSIVNRSLAKAEDLKALILAHFPDYSVDAAMITQIDTIKKGADLLINATSLGLHETDALPVDLEGVAIGTIIADIIMVPEMTKWLTDARDRGLTIHKGRHMLDYQKDLIANFLGAWS